MTDASEVTYSALDPADWDKDANPGNVDDALDQIADSLTGSLGVASIRNGSFHESFDATTASDGTTVTMSLEQSGTGDLTMFFSDGETTLDCTPAATIALTAGSDASPQTNYIYIPQSTKVLTKSTSAWPSAEHAKVAFFFVQSAASVQTAGGVIINQNWNDHVTGTDNQGHLLHMAERIRRSGSVYFSGVAGNGSDNYLTPTASNVELIMTSGVIYQMHQQTFPAFDTSGTDTVHVKNWSGDAYHAITNLFDITDDSTGTTITNNKYFNLVLWGVVNKSGEHQTVIINLPSGFYNTQSGAEQDSSGYDDFAMPREFSIDSSTGFLIARITIQMGTTWTVASTTDLRGTTPQTASGGASGSTSSFADNAFNVFDNTDNTKVTVLDVGTNVPTGTTRTMTIPNADVTILGGPEATVTDNEIFVADGTAGLKVKSLGVNAPTVDASGNMEVAGTINGDDPALRVHTDDATLAGASFFLDEDTLSSDSATQVASQQSIKAYVDAATRIIYDEVNTADATRIHTVSTRQLFDINPSDIPADFLAVGDIIEWELAGNFATNFGSTPTFVFDIELDSTIVEATTAFTAASNANANFRLSWKSVVRSIGASGTLDTTPWQLVYGSTLFTSATGAVSSTHDTTQALTPKGAVTISISHANNDCTLEYFRLTISRPTATFS